MKQNKNNARNKSKEQSVIEISRFIDLVHQLRKQCPWDRKQTHKSLVPYLIEEAYETVDAIESKSMPNIKEELGDLLLQIVLHSEIATEHDSFTLADVANCICEKMIHRHPHIFSSAKIKTAKDQIKSWSKIKEKERPKQSLLSGTPKAMPALQLAQRYGEIAASVNFDWEDASHVLDKVEEELLELKNEISRHKRNKAAMEMELGDLLFTLTRLAGHLEINAENALRLSSKKFFNRFSQMERKVKSQGKDASTLKLPQWEALWKEAKKKQLD